MPETTRGYTYPASTGHTRLWEHFQELATDVDTDVEALSDSVDAKCVVVFKDTTESVTSSTTQQDDDELTVALGVGIWRIEAFLSVTGATAGDFKCAWAFDGTITGTPGRMIFGPTIATTDSTATTVRFTQNGVGTLIAYGVDAALASAIHEDLLYNVTAAGTLTLQWAQNASSGTATNVLAGSRLYVTKLTGS